jgi:hypothetical protein
MIVVEGVDGTGKSNLVEWLHKATNLPKHERAATSLGGPIDSLWDWAVNDVESWTTQPLSIYDRHPLISEYIYGPIVRNKLPPEFLRPTAAGLLNRMAKLGLVIFCMPDLETVKKNMQNEEFPQMAGVTDRIEQLYMAYQIRASSWPGWCVTYDYRKQYSEGKNSHSSVMRAVRLHIATFGRDHHDH